MVDMATGVADLVVVTDVADLVAEKVAADPVVAAVNADIRLSNSRRIALREFFYPIKMARAGAPSDPTSFNGRQYKS